MADVTRPATWDDVKTLARLLDEEGARWALIGGYAIAAHGFVRLSEDIDIPPRRADRRARTTDKELLMSTESLYEQWERTTREKGRVQEAKRALAIFYEARFGISIVASPRLHLRYTPGGGHSWASVETPTFPGRRQPSRRRSTHPTTPRAHAPTGRPRISGIGPPSARLPASGASSTSATPPGTASSPTVAGRSMDPIRRTRPEPPPPTRARRSTPGS